jgi:preprotein translocase subunit SecD
VAPPPSKGQIRPTRYLIALGTIFVVLFGIVLGGGSGSFANRLKPKLGLDLAGGATMTLVAANQNGKAPSQENLNTARTIIEQRVNGSGVTEAEVITQGSNKIVISAPGATSADELRQLGATAQLRFRKVVAVTTGNPSSTLTATPSATASASPGATETPTATPAATTTPATTTTPPATTAAATPTATGTAASGRTQAQIQASILEKLGPAASIAAQLQAPATANDPVTLAQLDAFSKLDGEEVAALPVTIQFNVPQVTCQKLNARPAGSVDDPAQQVVACGSPNTDDQNTKYKLDVAKLLGTDIGKASAGLAGQTATQWGVNLEFSGKAADKWQEITSEAFNNASTACPDPTAQATSEDGSRTVCKVAVVLDKEVITAPRIDQVLSTKSQITGNFTKDSATLLANQLKYGALPVSFEPGTVQSISPTLGADYLRAALLAAAIGLLLVIIYAFFYYRLLGLVIMLSLLLSGLLTFGMFVLLGRTIGVTLTLAGFAGLIVSLGVAADSFVIYFERLKDEIREGRSPRSAVPRAWIRARRTIITANAVTFLAALTLYLVGIGSVAGFAFALGLATLLDLIIVFLFRHPMMTLLANTPAFLSPRVSGLGRVLQHAATDEPASKPRPTRPKEA